MEIKSYNQLNIKEKEVILEEIKFIFFESSSVKSFRDDEHKVSFFNRWCGDYLKHYPEYFYLTLENGKLLGYLCGVIDSKLAINFLNVPAQNLFEDLFETYPAHLHINFHPDARGKGLGTILINHFENELKKREVRGLHLITSQSARNVSFYKKAGFNYALEREFNGSFLYFMGKKTE